MYYRRKMDEGMKIYHEYLSQEMFVRYILNV